MVIICDRSNEPVAYVYSWSALSVKFKSNLNTYIELTNKFSPVFYDISGEFGQIH
jgi:hypothetical protein